MNKKQLNPQAVNKYNNNIKYTFIYTFVYTFIHKFYMYKFYKCV